MYGHPDADTMEKLSDMEIQVYRTDKQGTIIAVSDGSNISWNMDPCNDYSSGDGESSGQTADSEKSFTAEEMQNGSTDEVGAQTQQSVQSDENQQEQEEMVWISATGSKYHSIPDCGNMNPDKAHQEPISQAEAEGYEACKKCF